MVMRLSIADFGLSIVSRLRGMLTAMKANRQSAIRNPQWLFGRRFLTGRSGDMVWNTLVIVTVLLPLSGLAIDVPRYFALRSRLQIAADAGAEAAAQAVDIRHYVTTGETRLEPDRYAGEAAWAFEAAVADLRARGYTANLDGVDLDEGADAVSTRASGTIRLFYNLTPPVTVRVGATSWYRMIRK
jgi:Flp pilus assembly protein TadG